MNTARRYDVVLLDALGTIVDLEPPWPHLVAALASRGVLVDVADARRAMLAEMTYYRAECEDASDRTRLADLRRRCACIVADELGAAAGDVPLEGIHDAMLESLRFAAFPEVHEVLGALRARGAGLIVVSNWDVSLHDVLEATGLRGLVDAVLTSAEVGAAKPDPRMLHEALTLAGTVPGRALMVGDGEADVQAARRAGCDAVQVVRGERGTDGPGTGVLVMPDLRALPALLDAGDPYPVQDA